MDGNRSIVRVECRCSLLLLNALLFLYSCFNPAPVPVVVDVPIVFSKVDGYLTAFFASG